MLCYCILCLFSYVKKGIEFMYLHLLMYFWCVLLESLQDVQTFWIIHICSSAKCSNKLGRLAAVRWILLTVGEFRTHNRRDDRKHLFSFLNQRKGPWGLCLTKMTQQAFSVFNNSLADGGKCFWFHLRLRMNTSVSHSYANLKKRLMFLWRLKADLRRVFYFSSGRRSEPRSSSSCSTVYVMERQSASWLAARTLRTCSERAERRWPPAETMTRLKRFQFVFTVSLLGYMESNV